MVLIFFIANHSGDWKLRIGIFPEDEEVLVGGLGFGGVALQNVGASR